MKHGYTVIIQPDRASVVFIWVEATLPGEAAQRALRRPEAVGNDIVMPTVIAILDGWVRPLRVRSPKTGLLRPPTEAEFVTPPRSI